MNPFIKFFVDIAHNPVFLSAGAAWLLAQLMKIAIDSIRHGFNAKRLTGSGGMPSSHSATVTGLTVSCLITHTASSSEFAISLMLAMIVIYDAMGVRLETGKEAKILNRLRRRDIREGVKPLFNTELEEKMGHTLPEVVVGVIIGIAMAILMCWVETLIP